MNRELQYVLKQYGIQPISWKQIKNVFYIETAYGPYALKKTRRESVELSSFLQLIRYFERENIHAIVPVLRTLKGERIVQRNQYIYYLTPWVGSTQNKQRRHETEMLHTLGLFHRYNEYTVDTKESHMEQIVKQANVEKERQVLMIERYADQIEKNLYYSPFELSVLTHLPFVFHLYEEVERLFETWANETAEKGHYRCTLNHGNLHPDHGVTDKRGYTYFIHLEQAKHDHPSVDLARWFTTTYQQYRWDPIDGPSWLSRYEQHFTLTEGDCCLFFSRLLSPSTFLQSIEQYVQTISGADELAFVRDMESYIWMQEKYQQFIASWEKKKKKTSSTE